MRVLAVVDQSAGPVVSIALPQRVPVGPHGPWLSGVGMDAARG